LRADSGVIGFNLLKIVDGITSVMGGQIHAYFDCVSPYSYYALLYLKKNREALASYGVTVEIHPIFLGGINVGSGNKPPWTLPAKAKYGSYDGKRAQKYFGVSLQSPSFFPILSLLPQRCMLYVKDAYPAEKFEAAFAELWIIMWQEGVDISKPDNMAKALSRHFPEGEVKTILGKASDPYYKQKLLDDTKKVVEMGAFGAPWMMVTNGDGVTEPFFGSDRFHYMWEFLGLKWNDISLEPKPKL